MRFKVDLKYDGSNYAGWQRQANKITIQQVVEDSLTKMFKKSIVVYASGRTDAGVHALKQVIHFDVDVVIDSDSIVRGMNSLLPLDVRVTNAYEMPIEFHARYHSIEKTYKYVVNTNEFDLFERMYAYQYNRGVDIELMNSAKEIFIGTHDFTSFNATTLKENHNQIRTITQIDIIEDNGIITFIFSGTGFLRYMVRMLVETILMVGTGKISIADVQLILEKQEKGTCRYKAPACGLYLFDVKYPIEYMIGE